MKAVVSIALLGGGIVLMVVGVNATESLSSDRRCHPAVGVLPTFEDEEVGDVGYRRNL